MLHLVVTLAKFTAKAIVISTIEKEAKKQITKKVEETNMIKSIVKVKDAAIEKAVALALKGKPERTQRVGLLVAQEADNILDSVAKHQEQVDKTVKAVETAMDEVNKLKEQLYSDEVVVKLLADFKEANK